MADSYQFVLSQLNRLPDTWGLKIRGKHGWIKCPWHKNGQESTPSLMINLERKITSKGTFGIGSGRCHACGQFVPGWNVLADKLSLATDTNSVETYQNPFDEDMDRAVLDDGSVSEYVPDIENMIPWNPEEDWRTIKGPLLSKVGARLMFNEVVEVEQLYLPCYVNKKHVGGVQANLKKRGKRNYFNTPGEWTRDLGLYPYDYVKKLIKKNRWKTAVLVEGARDALKSVQYGIPALGILGTGNWSERKADLLLSLGVTRLLIAFDPDEAGLKATKVVYKSLKDELEIKRFNFKPDTDPGNMSPEVAIKMKQYVR